MKKRKKVSRRFFTPGFFLAVKIFFGEDRPRWKETAKKILEKKAAILKDPIKLKEAEAKGSNIIREIQEIYTAGGERGQLLKQFSQEFDLLAFSDVPVNKSFPARRYIASGTAERFAGPAL